MSMTRDQIAQAIDLGNLTAFTKLREHQFEIIADDIVACCQPDSPRLTQSSKVIELLNLLRDTRPTYLNILLESQTIHFLILDHLKTANAENKEKYYRYLLDQYIEHPELFYQAFAHQNRSIDIFKELENITDDQDKLWYLEVIKEFFLNADKFQITPICRFLSDLTSNEPHIQGLEEEDHKFLLKLKKISTHATDTMERVDKLMSTEGADPAIVALFQRLKKIAAEKEVHEESDVQDDKELLDFTNVMKKFVHGLSKLTIDDVLLVCAQLAERKKQYNFNPVVMTDDQFGSFLKLLKEGPKPVRQRFILTGDGTEAKGNHTIAGDIEIDVDGYAKVAFFDSLGFDKTDTSAGVFVSTKEVMRVFRDVFPLGSPIFLGIEPRQNSDKGCDFFALDDVVHFYNPEALLGGKNIFDYFAEQQKPLTKVGVIKMGEIESPLDIYCCNLPLSLLRTMQSEKIITSIVADKDATLEEPLNKKRDRFVDILKSQFFKPKPSNPKEQINTRLNYKVDRMAQENVPFLLTHTPAGIEDLKRKFTMKGLRKRIEASEQRTDVAGNTPLHIAVMQGKVEDALHLIGKGADLLEPNPRGRSAIEFMLVNAVPDAENFEVLVDQNLLAKNMGVICLALTKLVEQTKKMEDKLVILQAALNPENMFGLFLATQPHYKSQIEIELMMHSITSEIKSPTPMTPRA